MEINIKIATYFDIHHFTYALIALMHQILINYDICYDLVSTWSFLSQLLEPNVFIFTRKPCSGYKMKEMTGSGIFADDEGDDVPESGTTPQKTSVRIVQVWLFL